MLQAAIIELIADVVEFVNVGRNMTPNQVAMTARLIAEKYYYLKLQDIQQCFTQGCTGEYGQLYERLDGTILMQWIEKYDAERVKALRKKQAEAGTENLYELFQAPVMKDILTEVTDKLLHKEKPAPEPYVPPVKHPIQIQIDEEWEALSWYTYEGGKQSSHFKMYHGNPIDYVSFYNKRYSELVAEMQGEDDEQPFTTETTKQ